MHATPVGEMNGVVLDCYGLAMLFLNVTARCDSCQVVDYFGQQTLVCAKCLEERRSAYA